MRSTVALSALLALATASVASASVISFDPDGAGAAPVAQVGSFDFLPGNLLLVPDQSSTNGATLYYQARLGSLLDGTGHVISTPGLNGPAGDPSSYEITAVFSIGATVTQVGASPNAVSIQLTNFGSANSSSYYSLYFDQATHASDLAGTGFRDGTLIYSGATNSLLGSLAFIPLSAGIFPLDMFGADNYYGLFAPMLSGGLTIAASTVSEDSSFFVTPTSDLLTSGSASDPFADVDPSGSFEIGPDGSPFLTRLINPASIYGGNGDDMLVESDATTSFVVAPEPASLSLLALGAAPLVRRRRK